MSPHSPPSSPPPHRQCDERRPSSLPAATPATASTLNPLIEPFWSAYACSSRPSGELLDWLRFSPIFSFSESGSEVQAPVVGNGKAPLAFGGKRKAVAAQRVLDPPRLAPRSGFMAAAHTTHSGRACDSPPCPIDEGWQQVSHKKKRHA
jgi:hypothetical protein